MDKLQQKLKDNLSDIITLTKECEEITAEIARLATEDKDTLPIDRKGDY